MKSFSRVYLPPIFLFLSVLIFPGVLSSQELKEEGFLGRGISKIEDNHVSDARKSAFMDAREKVLISAVSSYLPVGDIAEYFLMLKKLFFDHPDIYLQRFKIISEHALYDRYQVNIRGFVQQDLLRKDLESMGVMGTGREKLKVLLMISEKGLSDPEEISWWKPGPDVSSNADHVTKKLSAYFRDSGFYVVEPGKGRTGGVVNVQLETDADPAEAAAFASGFGADIVVIGTAELKKTESRRLTSVESVQCGMNARIIRVRDAAVVVHASAYKLGMHVDELSAAREAIDKACMHLTGQIVDKLYLKLRNLEDYDLRLSMDEGASESDVEMWLDALRKILPDVVSVSIVSEAGLWTVRISSSIKRADIVQKILQFGVAGYSSEIIAADENVIEINVSSLKEALQ